MSESNPHVLGELSSYLDGAMPAPDIKRVDAHLKTCSGCQRHYAELRALRQMLQSGPTFTPSERFYKETLRRINQPKPSWADLAWSFPARAVASACVLLIGVWVTHEVRKQPHVMLAPVAKLQPAAPAAVLSREKDSPREEKETDKASAPVSSGKNLDSSVPNKPAPMLQTNRGLASLSDRKDIVTEARDTNGPAAQNSFKGSQAYLGTRQQTSAVDETSTLKSKGAGASMASAEAALAGSGTAGAIGGGLKKEMISSHAVFPEWKGTSSGVKDARTVIVESSDAWQTLWREHTAGLQPQPPAPEVDFTRNLVIGVFAGQKATGGYSIEITETRTTPGVLVVLYHETIPAPNTTNTAGPTQPFHLQVIPKSSLLIQFKKI